MKALIIFTIIFIGITELSASNLTTKQSENKRLCQVFKEKVLDYKINIRNDIYAKKTLSSYKKKAKFYCSK